MSNVKNSEANKESNLFSLIKVIVTDLSQSCLESTWEAEKLKFFLSWL